MTSAAFFPARLALSTAHRAVGGSIRQVDAHTWRLGDRATRLNAAVRGEWLRLSIELRRSKNRKLFDLARDVAFRGGVKLGVEPNTGRLHLCVDLPIEEDGFESRCSRAIDDLLHTHQALRTQPRRSAKNGARRAQATDSTLDLTVADSVASDRADRPAVASDRAEPAVGDDRAPIDIAALCVEGGWIRPSQAPASGTSAAPLVDAPADALVPLRIVLDHRGAVVATIDPRRSPLVAEVRAGRMAPESQAASEAIGHAIAVANGALRMVRITLSPDRTSDTLAFEACAYGRPTAGAIDHALASLAIATTTMAPEIRALAQHDLAIVYNRARRSDSENFPAPDDAQRLEERNQP